MSEKYDKKRKVFDMIGRTYAFICAFLLIVITVSIFYFVATKGLSTFIIDKRSIKEFLFGTLWKPDRPNDQGGPAIGSLQFILGSVFVSVFAILISTPLSICAAIFMVEIAKKIW